MVWQKVKSCPIWSHRGDKMKPGRWQSTSNVAAWFVGRGAVISWCCSGLASRRVGRRALQIFLSSKGVSTLNHCPSFAVVADTWEFPLGDVMLRCLASFLRRGSEKMIWESQYCPVHSTTLVLSQDTWSVCLSCATVLLDRQGSPRTVVAHGELSFSAISKSSTCSCRKWRSWANWVSHTSTTKFSRTLSSVARRLSIRESVCQQSKHEPVTLSIVCSLVKSRRGSLHLVHPEQCQSSVSLH